MAIFSNLMYSLIFSFKIKRKIYSKELRREAMETLTLETKNDALLASLPGRICSNGASNVACIYTQQGRKGTNQDAMVVWEDFASMEDTVYCGVYDGHGPYGHLVARRVRDSLPSKLLHYWQEELTAIKDNSKESDTDNSAELCDTAEMDRGSNVSNHNDEVVRKPPMFQPWMEAHRTAYRVMDKELRSHPLIDCFCSGTTAVTVLKQGKHLVIGNVGDSRAIMGTRDENGVLKAIQLTVDLKPNLPQEADRIREYKGRVFALHDEPEVFRVWLPFDDSPGLAMARAFGDFCLKDYGVISDPEISYRQLTDRDLFIVLASDGIWDVLSNDEVVHIVASAPTHSTAAQALVESAVRVWRLKYPTSKVDDCAVVCLYLDDAALISRHLSRADISSVLSEDEGAAEGGEILNERKEMGGNETQKKNSLADWLDAEEDQEWSALEGVTRVNSLLNLPRFTAADKRAAGTPKGPVTMNSK
ncbi:unnamed protein product [Sphagnum balticum]